MNLTASCFMNRNGVLEGVSISTKKRSGISSRHVSRRWYVRVCTKGHGKPLLAQSETEKKKHSRTNGPERDSVGVVWYFKMFHFQSEIFEATAIYVSPSYLKRLYKEKYESCYLRHYNTWEANGVNFLTLLHLTSQCCCFCCVGLSSWRALLINRPAQDRSIC